MEPIAAIGPNNLWNWTPAGQGQPQAQSLEALQALGVNSVVGQMRCAPCDRQETVTLDLLADFNELRAQLLANRGAIIEGGRVQNLPFGAFNKLKKELCPHCRKSTLVPLLADVVREPQEPLLNFSLRKVVGSNLLFLLLSNQLRFFETDDLRAVMIQFGFSRRRFTASTLVANREPKSCYVPAVALLLTQVLDPANRQQLRLESWPVEGGPVWN